MYAFIWLKIMLHIMLMLLNFNTELYHDYNYGQTLPTVTVAPAASIMVKTSEGKF